MILEIDIGNTRLKWRVRQGQDVKASAAEPVAQALESLKQILVEWGDSLSAIYVSSVVSKWQQPLLDLIEAYSDVVPVFAKTVRYCSGITNAYTDVQQMGVDRWLALLAAFKQYSKDVVVVDAGSAVTIDLLQANGSHLGGYIVPGLQMMRQSLFQTDQVAVDTVIYPSQLEPGISTEQAVLAGLPLMVEGLVLQSLKQLQDITGELPAIVVTGGDGAYLFDKLNQQYTSVCLEPDLVLNGLELSIQGDSLSGEGNH